PAAFLDALKSAGITIELLPAANTDTSIESAGLRITQVQQMGPATQKVSFIIGHVSARIDGEAAPAKNDLLGDTLPASSSPGTVANSEPPAPSAPAAVEAPSPAPAVSEANLDTAPAPAALPDLSTLPPALEAAAASPTQTAPAPRVTAPPPPVQVRLASPAASIGRGLRDDDVT